ncbi:hypothetical protein IC575_030592 [Cucumis melo]
MHWSTDVYHAPEFTYSNVHLLPKTSHLWILSGGSCGCSVVPFSLYKDQDQINVHSLCVERRYISSLSVNNDKVGQKFYGPDLSGKNESGIPDYSELNPILCTGQSNLTYPAIFHGNSDLLAKRRRNGFIIQFESLQEREKELRPPSGISIEIPINGLFRRNSILAFFDDPQYRRNSSGITKYGTIGVHSILKKEDLIEYRGVKDFKPKYQMQMKVDRFFFIPEEVHILPESSSIMVRNNSIIGVATRLTLSIRSRVGGLVRMDKISRHNGILIPPERVKKNSKKSKKSKNWIYVQWITPTKKKYFVFVRPVIIYELADGINLVKLFPQDLLQERDNLELRVVNYILYGNGKPIRGISGTSIQLVRTCLLLNWDRDKKALLSKTRASFVEEIRYCVYEKRKDPSGSGLIFNNESDRTNINPFFSIYSKTRVPQSPSQNQGTIRTLFNRNKERQSLIILSASNCLQMDLFNDVKDYNVIKESSKKDPLISIRNSLGPLGAAPQIVNFYSFYDLITHNPISLTKYLQLDNLKQTFQVLKYYLMDENGGIFNSDPCSNIKHLQEQELVLDIFFFENVCIAKNRPHLKSGQIIIVEVDSVVIRLAKPYLATSGATVHRHYGEMLYEGDTLVTFIYEKSRSGDITQGLPKVEQVLEVRSIDSISMSLEKRIEGWNERITRILGIPWGFLIGSELTIVQSRISLVNKIQKVYRSQGVEIHNRHIEIIVRQITSKVLVSEDGMSNVFSPGELIGLLRAERTGRALEEAICYRAVLLGITKASLNTQSFISEASFQETARVLAKAALRGRIDWLRGLKENVVLGGMIPVGTGFRELAHRSRQHNNIPLEPPPKKIFEGEMRDILFHHKELFDFFISTNLHDTSEQAFLGFNDS